jgi:hypothetical protein
MTRRSSSIRWPTSTASRRPPAVGLVGAAIAYVRCGWPLNQGLTRRTVMALTIFALLFTAAMTIPAKKFDRYILPPHELGQSSVAAGDHITATLYLQSMAEMDVNYNVLLRLVGQDGERVVAQRRLAVGRTTADWPLAETRPDGHRSMCRRTPRPGCTSSCSPSTTRRRSNRCG